MRGIGGTGPRGDAPLAPALTPREPGRDTPRAPARAAAGTGLGDAPPRPSAREYVCVCARVRASEPRACARTRAGLREEGCGKRRNLRKIPRRTPGGPRRPRLMAPAPDAHAPIRASKCVRARVRARVRVLARARARLRAGGGNWSPRPPHIYSLVLARPASHGDNQSQLASWRSGARRPAASRGTPLRDPPRRRRAPPRLASHRRSPTGPGSAARSAPPNLPCTAPRPSSR